MARRPHRNPVNRENQVIAAAYDLVEQQIRDGTASPTILHHLLKMGSRRNQLEEEGIRKRNELMDAQTESIKQAQQLENKYTAALEAMRRYSGQVEEVDDSDIR